VNRPGTDRRASAKLLIAALLVAGVGLGWLDSHSRAREANRLYAAGKYDEAAETYNQALIDHPDSPLLHFNLGDAAYKKGKYDDALAAFQQVPIQDGDTRRTARVAYNLGNATYRLGAAAESADPKRALDLYGGALAAYRRALGADPDDADAKFNYEFVAQKLEALKKKIEQEQQQKEQKPAGEDQNKERQPQDEQKSDQAKQEQPSEQKPSEEARPQQQQAQAAAGPSPAPSPEQRTAGGGDSREKPAEPREANNTENAASKPEPALQSEGGAQKPEAAAQAQAAGAASGANGEMSRQEATALLDAQRDQELRPDEVVRRLEGAVVAEPAEDW